MGGGLGNRRIFVPVDGTQPLDDDTHNSEATTKEFGGIG